MTLGEGPQDIREVVALDATYTGGASVDVVNGTAGEFNGTLYTVEDSGYVYHLSEDGIKLVDERNLDVTPTAGSALETEFNNMVAAYNADKINIGNAETTTEANKLVEDANWSNADGVFTTDSNKIAELDGYFATVGAATDALAAAQDAQQVAADAYAANDELFQAAKEVYDAPILETITNGANDAIDDALAQGGAIRNELDQKVNLADAEEIFADKQQWVDNTLGIESANSNAVSDALTGEIAGDETTFSGAINAIDDAVSQNTADIVTNAENIAENKVAIEEEVANRIAGDEMTLASAKAYVDSKNELALKSAYDYTDHKVGALEEDLSAGVASAVAMSSVAVSGVGKGEVSVGGGYGYYNSQSAIALGAAMGISDNWSVNAAAGLADSNVTFRAGTNYKFKLF
ncbi:MAG: YadA C-terminal domain-containing protein [Alphaproteobacteria bacterium]|nr:YadA C-terminal domain-containing protein [Alphaproteobacteria bacterium]